MSEISQLKIVFTSNKQADSDLNSKFHAVFSIHIEVIEMHLACVGRRYTRSNGWHTHTHTHVEMDVFRSSGRRRPVRYFAVNKINGFRSSSEIRGRRFFYT